MDLGSSVHLASEAGPLPPLNVASGGACSAGVFTATYLWTDQEGDSVVAELDSNGTVIEGKRVPCDRSGTTYHP